MADEKPKTQEHTPDFNFKFDPETITVAGKERKIEMKMSGLYVFDEKEDFEKPKPESVAEKQGVWVGFKKPMSDGKVLIPLTQRGGFPLIKARGRTIKGILELTQPLKKR